MFFALSEKYKLNRNYVKPLCWEYDGFGVGAVSWALVTDYRGWRVNSLVALGCAGAGGRELESCYYWWFWAFLPLWMREATTGGDSWDLMLFFLVSQPDRKNKYERIQSYFFLSCTWHPLRCCWAHAGGRRMWEWSKSAHIFGASSPLSMFLISLGSQILLLNSV